MGAGAALHILRATKKVYIWGQDRSNTKHLQSFHRQIAQDKEIVKIVLLLTGAVEGAKTHVNDYLTTFDRYNCKWCMSTCRLRRVHIWRSRGVGVGREEGVHPPPHTRTTLHPTRTYWLLWLSDLWQNDKQKEYDKFMKSGPEGVAPDIETFSNELKKYMDVEREIRSIPSVHVIGCMCLDSSPLMDSLITEAIQVGGSASAFPMTEAMNES
jgi:hypothetical protein